jgi:soluble lytic murein transglycosylase-like protein
MLFAACSLTLAPPQNGLPCGSVPNPLRVTALPIVARPAGDISSRIGGILASHSASLIDRWEPYIAEAAQRFAIPKDWIRAVMHSESGGRTTMGGQPITSVAGAMGLMQLMPGTYADMRSRYGLGHDSYDPHDNVLAGAAYLGLMYRQYGYPSLFAAYNAGPARFDGYLLGGKALPNATLAYVGSIVPGVETTMARGGLAYRNATANAVIPATNRHLDASNQRLFFALNQPSDTQLLPTNETEISPKSPRASATNVASNPEFVSQNPVKQTGGLFVPLSHPTP